MLQDRWSLAPLAIAVACPSPARLTGDSILGGKTSFSCSSRKLKKRGNLLQGNQANGRGWEATGGETRCPQQG